MPLFAGLLLALTGCSSTVDKSANLTIIYGLCSVLSLLLLIGCCIFVRRRRLWFIVLFSSVFVVNVGYTLLASSSCLSMALNANRLSYLGSVFLPLSMLMIILDVTNTRYKKWLPIALFGVAAVAFLIAASPGILNIYYKSVSFEIIGGVSTLVKVYGPLHPIYLIYLLGYFSAMVTIIIRASIKGTTESASHSVILAIAVFVNIGVWLIEQFVSFKFEMLSVSYIISELFLLGIHLVMNENQQLRDIVKRVEQVQGFFQTVSADGVSDAYCAESVEVTRLEIFINGVNELTPTEKAIYEAYTARLTTKEILEKLSIKENTLKYHNKNIYSKLGVSSRKELFEVYKQVLAVKETLN